MTIIHKENRSLKPAKIVLVSFSKRGQQKVVTEILIGATELNYNVMNKLPLVGNATT
jgi:hypothetical protein